VVAYPCCVQRVTYALSDGPLAQVTATPGQDSSTIVGREGTGVASIMSSHRSGWPRELGFTSAPCSITYRSTGFAFNSPSGYRVPENTRPGSDTATAPWALLPTRTEKTYSSVGYAERIVSNPHKIVPNEVAQAEAARGTSRTNTPFTTDPSSEGSRTPSSTTSDSLPTASVEAEERSE
jgi:hypothetical protein